MDQRYEEIIKKLGNRVKINEPMSAHTTFKIGGPADLFFEAKTEKEILKAVEIARKLKIPYFILGGGSNILVGDRGFRGMIVIIQNSKFKIQNSNSKFKIVAGAGLALSSLVNKSLELSVTGLEFLAGIPGTVGGAIRGNAGAWQQSFGDTILLVKVLNEAGKIENISRQDCIFTYRDSRFKRSNEIILETEFVLKKGNANQIKNLVKENLEKRANQPKEPSAGCVFINPGREPAGLLIDKCGLKGFILGGAQISEEHANFIINIGGAKAADVIALISIAKQKVKEKFGIDLKEEIVRMGEF